MHVALCHRGGLSMGRELYPYRGVGPSVASFWDFGDECCLSDRLLCGNFTRINTQSLHRRHPLAWQDMFSPLLPNEEIDVVHAQRCELAVRSLQSHEKPAERDVGFPAVGPSQSCLFAACIPWGTYRVLSAFPSSNL